jgi:hypothetical protein
MSKKKSEVIEYADDESERGKMGSGVILMTIQSEI